MASKHFDEDDDSSSNSSTVNKDDRKKGGHHAKDSALSPKAEPESLTTAPLESPPPPPSPSPSPPPPTPLKPSSPPPSKNLTTSRPPSRSPPPPSPSPPPQSPPPHSPRPPSSPQPQSQQLHNDNSSPSPSNPRRQAPPPPQFRAPPPPDRPSSSSSPPSSSSSSPSSSSSSSSSSPRHVAPKNDSAPGTSDKGSSYQAKHGGASPANSGGSASPASSSGDNAGKYVGYTLAGIFAVALVAIAVALVLVLKKKKAKDAYATSYVPPLNLHLKSGANGHYYVQQPGPPISLATYGNGALSMRHLGAPIDSPQPKSAQLFFTYEMVMEITNAFSSQNIIGEGGFGFVYKGLLPDGRIVAVKQLKAGSGQGEREFKAEVEIISRVHHRHLVALVGYCIFEQHRILIYEYVPNGTLHQHLHGSRMPVLNWAKRLKIAIGAAKGLAYLHEDCSQKIIHRDIKSANILLDDAFEAQVADFGLARLADAANTHVSTRVMGTFGYMAPEYATSGKLTDRSDVFSFGVVLLELLTGRKPVDQTQPLGDESLVEWARPLLPRAIETRDFSEVIDPRLEKRFVECEMLRMIEAAAACVRHSAPRRPRMVQVVRALDFGNESSDLSNGVKYGHSTVYDSGQYDKEIMLFRRMANGTFVDSDFDMYSREYSLSRDSETSRGSQQELMSSSGESEFSAINKHRSSSG